MIDMACLIRLRAQSENGRTDRSYELTCEQDLFGRYVVKRAWGRTGARGRELVDSFATIGEAAGYMVTHLKRRRGSQSRCGAVYYLTEFRTL